MLDITNFTPLWGVWNIVRQIGSGTFGDVYEVRRSDIGREFRAAVKHISIPPRGTTLQSLRSDGTANDAVSAQRYCQELLDTLVKEIDICYELKGYTNFVSYEDHMIIPRQGEIGFDVFIRMELLTTLQNHIDDKGITIGGISKLCDDMCTALAVLEQKHIVHRDIKPANIFVNTAGEFKLGDFGVARHMERLGSMSVKGTYNYMAPEIFRGDVVGHNSDIYSLGLVLYRLLNNNRAPFLPPPPTQISFQEDQDALDKRLTGVQLPLPARAELSVPLANVVMRACEYEPSRRFQTAIEMKQTLQDFRDVERKSSRGYSTGGVDTDATVAVERIAPQSVFYGSGGYASSRYQQGSSINKGSSLGSGTPPYGLVSRTGESAQPPPMQSSTKLMFTVLFSIIGLVFVILIVIIILVMRNNDVPANTPPVGTYEAVVPSYIPPPNAPTPTPVPLPTPRPTTRNDDFVLPFSSTRYLTDEDLRYLTKAELYIARNEIYARHGRRFQTPELQVYFDSKAWYAELDKLPLGTEPTLTYLEQANVAKIQEYE